MYAYILLNIHTHTCLHTPQVLSSFKQTVIKAIVNIISFMLSGRTESTILFNGTFGLERLKFHPSRNNHFSLCHTVWIIYC